MPIVVTIDQRRSRESQSLDAPELVNKLNAGKGGPIEHRFEVTIGDELQGVLDDPSEIVSVIRTTLATGRWWIGVGIGTIEELASSPRHSSGQAFFEARQAVTRSKKHRWGIAAEPRDLQAVSLLDGGLALWATLLGTRTAKGWDAVTLRYSGLSESEVAERLGITQQAAHDRLRNATYAEDEVGAALVAALARQASVAEDA